MGFIIGLSFGFGVGFGWLVATLLFISKDGNEELIVEVEEDKEEK